MAENTIKYVHNITFIGDVKIIFETVIKVVKREDIYVVHRLVGIENIDNEDRYYTKGDANEDNDPGYITRSDIVGVTKFKLSYFGYPTLWLRELFD